MIIANIYALKAPSLRWNGMVVFSSMTVLFLHPSHGYKWLTQSAEIASAFSVTSATQRQARLSKWRVEPWRAESCTILSHYGLKWTPSVNGSLTSG